MNLANSSSGGVTWNIQSVGSGVSGRTGNLEINNGVIDIFAIKLSNGNVGIGTTSPTYKLDVTGTAHVTSDLTVDGNIKAKYQDVAEWVPATHALSADTVVTLNPITITVSSQGMTPSSATVSAGIVHLLVKNTSSVETLQLKVVRESGEVVKEMSAPNSSGEWAIELELSAGQYTISEATNRLWNCHLTAEAPPSSGGLPVPANP